MKNSRDLSPEDVLVVRESGRARADQLRTAMLNQGIPHRCAICGIPPKWRGLVLVLQVDHIDGNYLDCRLHNLRFLCPNCHTQTETFGRAKVAAPKAIGELTYRQAQIIRKRYGPYVPFQHRADEWDALAAEFGSTRRAIMRVIKGQTFPDKDPVG